VVIKRSAGEETRALIADLAGEDDVRREAAIARLSVIGTRAVERLVTVVTSLPAPGERTTVAALRALESIGDVRALAPALSLLDSPHPAVGAAAVGVARTFLRSRRGTEVLDRLVALALDPERPDATRLAALDALTETGTRVLAPVWERLREDRSLAIQQRAARATGSLDPLAELEAAATGVVPDDADAFRALIEKTAATAPLATLHRLIEVVRSREADERPGRGRGAWLSVRGAIHAALARRESRVALYDLRETIAAAPGPLPPPFVAAVTVIGDAASLEAIAEAAAKAVIADQSEWLAQLKAAFQGIAAREHIGGRHAVVKRIETKWPGVAAELIGRKK
jgi:HEAT repeat protein